MKLSTTLSRLAALLLSLALVYFSFKSQPEFSGDPVLPGWLEWFGDTFPDFRTFVPFFLYAILLPFLPRDYSDFPGKTIFLGCAALAVFLVSSELIQYFMPRRQFAWMDLIWGAAGIVCGAILGIGAWVMRRSGEAAMNNDR